MTLIDPSADGATDNANPHAYPTRFKVKRGLFEDLMGDDDPQAHDYLFFELEDRDPISEVMNRLRDTYPNAVHLTYVRRDIETTLSTVSKQHHEVRIETHFARFFEEVTGAALAEDQEAVLLKVIRDLGEDLEPVS